jgi:competence protein ComEA
MIRQLLIAALAALTLNAFAGVDVNSASRAELESVKGIGPGLSAKILKARETGAFKDWPDLVQRVGGVGSGSAAKLSKAGLVVGGQAFDPQAMPAAAKAPKARKAADKKSES